MDEQKTSFQLGAVELILLIVAAGAVINKFIPLEKIDNFVNSINSTVTSIYSFFISQQFYLILLVVILALVFYFSYALVKSIFRKIRMRKEKLSNLRKAKVNINELLDKDFHNLNLAMLQEVTTHLQNELMRIEKESKLAGFKEPMLKRLREAKLLFSETKHKQKVQELFEQRTRLEKDIKRLDTEKRKKDFDDEQKKDSILRRLNIEENFVFKKEELHQEEVEVLLEKGFSWANEFCVNEQKIILTLVKPILNHSKTHTFLVWSVKKVLETIEGIYFIHIHLTKDADITYYYNGKRYALEIETGSLLGKTRQTEEKIRYLNRKYPNRWMFIVSNKNLLPKYRKLGLATQRIGVAENVQKMLKSSSFKNNETNKKNKLL